MADILKFPTPEPDPIPAEEEVEMSVTENSRLTFGKHKRKKLCNCPKKYLEWMVKSLKNTDFHEWALAAEAFLEKREAEDAPTKDLEDAADEILRNHGFDPKQM